MEKKERCRVSDPLYQEVIEQFLFEEFPGVEVSEEVRFEALSRAVLGTKQLRNGPLPKPEQQVEIREIFRKNKHLHFFTAWGCRKQDEKIGFDILDFCALKQLYSLRESIRRCGWDATFHFRLEDLTDSVIFATDSLKESQKIVDYRTKFTHFASPLGKVQWESHLMDMGQFYQQVREQKPRFLAYLKGRIPASDLLYVGWKGEIPQVQQNYYREMYKIFYPGVDPDEKMAEYFSIALARVNLKGAGTPAEEFIQISFVNPVPGDPIKRKRVNYRSLPERYTHVHKAPWLGKGYLKIEEKDGETTVTPKIAPYGEDLPLHKNTVVLDGVEIECDYLLV